MTERFSYMDLFWKEVDLDKETKVVLNGIVIPKIQRPYAQGRTDGVSTYVRETFLEELFSTVQGKEILDLNFIYGIIRPSDSGYIMELLDGQQRLTTLFLLHWYIANQELKEEDKADMTIRQSLAKFTYETRSSSKVFCKELANYHVQIPEGATPKDVLRKAKWYFKSFDRDSTISGMLTMLDAIHEYYIRQSRRDLNTCLDRLQFYVKSLGYYNLSEELYIKMNARGLQLSPFENFKADLTGFINSSDYSKFKDLVPLYKEGADETVPFSQNFSIKLDAKWVDLFWKAGSETFDVSFMAFFSRFFSYQYILSSKDEVSIQAMRKDATIKALYSDPEEKLGSNEYYGFKPFLKVLSKKPGCIISLDKAFDVLYDYDRPGLMDEIQKEMVPTWDRETTPADAFFYDTTVEMRQTKLIAMSAFFEFVDAYVSFDLNLFKQWMRVVWNIIENTNIDSLTPTSSLIRILSDLIHHIASASAQSPDLFYDGLASWVSDSRENRAVLEEVRKASRIKEDQAWLPLFIEAEKHDYFKGMVLFFYKDGMSIEDYQRAFVNISKVFDKNGITTEYRKDHLLIRAIVSLLSRWGDINQQYITEQAEKDKYLKNLLASNEAVRALFADIALLDDPNTVKNRLQAYIDNAAAPDVNSLWQTATDDDKSAFSMTIDRLRRDVRMYDWVFEQERANRQSFRVYLFEGQFMFAVKSKKYAKIPLDSERVQIAEDLELNCNYEYSDPNQKSMSKLYKHCFGNELHMFHILSDDIKIWVSFILNRNIEVKVEFKTIEKAKEKKDLLRDLCPVDGEDRSFIISTNVMSHLCYKKVYDSLVSLLKDVENRLLS